METGGCLACSISLRIGGMPYSALTQTRKKYPVLEESASGGAAYDVPEIR